MNHPKEEELIAYRDGQTTRREAIAEHVKTCAHCTEELSRIDALLEALRMVCERKNIILKRTRVEDGGIVASEFGSA